MRKGNVITLLLMFILFAGVCLVAYPTVSDWWNSTRHTKAITSYVDEVSLIGDGVREQMLAEAVAFNADLAQHTASGTLDDMFLSRYEETLDATGTGIMGYVEIPTIGCSLPIYHGTDDSVLQSAVGHLEWSSLPIGGEGTHCVVSGHRGLPSAKLFTDLDLLSEGDVFELHILGDVLAYEVERILIVEPDDTASLVSVEGEDLCTLVTCTPYGVNSHRLLVTGHRVDWSAASTVSVPADATQVEPTLVALSLAVPVLVLLFIAAMLTGGKKNRAA